MFQFILDLAHDLNDPYYDLETFYIRSFSTQNRAGAGFILKSNYWTTLESVLWQN